jgi:hypothetical protein
MMLTEKCLFASLGSKLGIMNQPRFSPPSSLCAGLALSLALVFVGTVPFGHALEIHHIFSEIDHDGHQHSDFDLCQWVKKHTSNTLVWDLPRVSHGSIGILFFFPENPLIYASLSGFLSYSRGPPRG